MWRAFGHDALCITACWLNVLAPARTHAAHSHPNNFLSGVYYVRTQLGADTVNFHDPRPQPGIIRPPVWLAPTGCRVVFHRPHMN